MYCAYGEQDADGGVLCYQPFPSACGEQSCPDAVQSPVIVQEDVLCCENGDCWEFPWETAWAHECGGYFSWCDYGYLDEDGTVDCYD